jgi:hypothetical protein
VRPWLTVIGVLFLTLGLGTAATLYFAGQDNPTTYTAVTAPPTFSLGPGATDVIPLNGANGSVEQFHLAWHSSAPLKVLLFEPEACTAPCSERLSLENWSANLSGTWTGSGPFNYPLYCAVTNLQSNALNVTLIGRAESTTPTHPSLLFEIVLGGGAGALLVVGGLAVFLGVFLRQNPYGPEPPLLPRSPEAIDEWARDEPPSH